MGKIMSTRESHAQDAVKESARIAAKVEPRMASPEKPVPPDLFNTLAMCMAPCISEDRDACIAAAAYFIAQRRGFSPGREMDDWLTAENDVDARLMGERCSC
jgi:hypothetical protein